MPPFDTDEARWEAVLHRTPEADGKFVYGVLTTGVYCRPVCRSRRPRRQNVRFFDTPAQAEAAGLRPCKRCQPHLPDPHPHRQAVLQACRLIDQSDEPPALADLAAAAGLSTAHFQRVFKKLVGVTPKQYALQKRLNRVQNGLQTEPTVTQAVYQAGYGSSSRFYEQAGLSLGMAPSTYRRGGEGIHIRYATAPCSLGWVLVATTDRGICAIEFADTPEALEERLKTRFPRARLSANAAELSDWMAQVLVFLEQPARGLDLPLDVQGTAFQRRVWQALQEIPPGTVASYGEIAERLGNPNAARAVARACAQNPVAVAIPCHRVVRQNGDIGGYRWGAARKKELLAREKSTSLQTGPR